MAQIYDSIINSPLFLNDQKKQKNHENKPLIFKSPNQTTINENILVINNENGSFQIDRIALNETLIELKTQYSVSVNDLSTEYSEMFKNVVETLRLLYGSFDYYNLVLTDIVNMFSDIANVIPGTVGAYFIGCFTVTNFQGNMGCNPICTSSLQPGQGMQGITGWNGAWISFGMGWSGMSGGWSGMSGMVGVSGLMYNECPDLVLIYSNNTFNSLNESQSVNCYIYIQDQNFQGFSQENIQQLQNTGVVNCSIIFINANGSYEITSYMTIAQLPLLTDNNTDTNTTNNTEEYRKYNSKLIILLVLIFLALILFFGGVILYARRNRM